jgi:hypothetical protein
MLWGIKIFIESDRAFNGWNTWNECYQNAYRGGNTFIIPRDVGRLEEKVGGTISVASGRNFLSNSCSIRRRRRRRRRRR